MGISGSSQEHAGTEVGACMEPDSMPPAGSGGHPMQEFPRVVQNVPEHALAYG